MNDDLLLMVLMVFLAIMGMGVWNVIMLVNISKTLSEILRRLEEKA